jgi:alpha-ketoglutarate-dependent taurine dioxygenase
MHLSSITVTLGSEVSGVDLNARPRYQMRLRWSPGTVVMWDNWATQHFASADHYPARREVQRVTIETTNAVRISQQ